MGPASEDVTHGEIMRELQRVHDRLDTMDRRFQPRDLAEAMAANTLGRVADLAADIRRIEDAQTASRRLALSALAYPILVALVAALIAYVLHGG